MIIAVDFDGTLVEHRFPEIGPAVPEAFEYCKKFQEAGAKLILYTMRSDGFEREYLSEAVELCREQGLEFWGVNTNPTQASWTNSPKCDAKLFIDDLAFGVPLVYPYQERAYVDWGIVGPKTLEMIHAYNSR